MSQALPNIGFEFEFCTNMSDYRIKNTLIRLIGVKFSRESWRIVNDVSVISSRPGWHGRELITTPVPMDIALQQLTVILEMFNTPDFEINYRCGLHVNIDIGKYTNYVDELSLILLLDERKILKKYKRTTNSFCASYITQIKKLKRKYEKLTISDDIVTYIRHNLKTDHTAIPGSDVKFKKHSVNFDKLNNKMPYIEFRLLGGASYCKAVNSIAKDIKSFGEAMFLAATGKKPITIKRRLNAL